ncbi:hypothetical protein [Aquicoccus sp. SU-CL01552]|uniref:hypothetical protein n=1 Tax=Aquicoccus sp. SU-CL01552 TaxID=3127656 RepID=UPI00333F8203
MTREKDAGYCATGIHRIRTIDKTASKPQFAMMKTRSKILLFWARTSLVLLLLSAGILGDTVRPHLTVAPGAEQIQLTEVHRPGMPPDDCVQSLRAHHAAPPTGSGVDGAPTTASEPLLPPEHRVLQLAAPRAPPRVVQSVARAHCTRAPPTDMI